MFRPVLALSTVAILAACSSTPPTAENTGAIPTVTPASATATNAYDMRQIDKLNKELAARSIYFSYDEFLIDTKYESMIKQNAELVKATPGVTLMLEGNADERGSSEYNLALGQKRADMVRKALAPQGVPESKVEAVSFGKEKPVAQCHEERCWSQNRRVDFVVKPLEGKK